MGRPRDVEKHRYWGAQIRAWERSGLGQAEFCRRQGLKRRLFGSWKRRLAAGPQGKESQARFVAVAIRAETERPHAPPAIVSTSLALVTGSGYRIEVGDGFVPQTLARLLATIEHL